jgi:hypothetical protein
MENNRENLKAGHAEKALQEGEIKALTISIRKIPRS